MTKSQIAKLVAEDAEISQKKALRAVNAVFSHIMDGVLTDGIVIINGFGKWTRKATKGRHYDMIKQKTVDGPPATFVSFKSGKDFKRTVKANDAASVK